MTEAPTITLVTDFEAVDDFQKKHTPFITLSTADDGVVVNVEVGHQVPHPNGGDHYITWIDLFANGSPIAHLDLSPEIMLPRFSLLLQLPTGTVIRALEHCNLHGLWAYEVTL